MSAVEDAEIVDLFEAEVHNPLGMSLEGGNPVDGNTWDVYASYCAQGAPWPDHMISLVGQPMSVETTRELVEILTEAIRAVKVMLNSVALHAYLREERISRDELARRIGVTRATAYRGRQWPHGAVVEVHRGGHRRDGHAVRGAVRGHLARTAENRPGGSAGAGSRRQALPPPCGPGQCGLHDPSRPRRCLLQRCRRYRRIRRLRAQHSHRHQGR